MTGYEEMNENMYQAMYKTLFRAAQETIELLEQEIHNPDTTQTRAFAAMADALGLLIRAQQDAEQIYILDGETQGNP